jgi:chemotaxis protein methyltransferase CheR
MDPSLTMQEFELLRRLVRQQTGIHLADHKRTLVECRLRWRIRELGTPSFMGYYRMICEGACGEDELQALVDSVTTHTTSFFRERLHFDFVARELARAWARRATGPRAHRIRVWSAACSTGQEAYSLAAVLWSAIPDLRRFDAKILGTDISVGALRQAEAARYPAKAWSEIPDAYRGAFRLAGPSADRQMIVAEEPRALVVLRPLNLMAAAYPFHGRFDAIFCRNVLIYFDEETRRGLVEKMQRVLAPGGHLFLGMSESLIHVPPGLRPLGSSIYESTE